jgi:hypothetical protein
MTQPDVGEDRWAPERAAALGFLLEGEQRVFEAYVDGLDRWLASVRANVFAPGPTVDPLGIYAAARALQGSFVKDVVAAIAEVIARAFARVYPQSPTAFTARPWVRDHLEEVGNHLTATPDWLFGKVRTDLDAGYQAGAPLRETAERIEATLLDGGAEVWKNRGITVARTETLSAYNGGTDQAMKALAEEFGLELEKLWLASMDARTRDTHFALDGQRVPADGVFNVGGFPALLPGDEQLPPGERINCRCTVLYVEPGEDVDMSNRGFRGDEATRDEVARRRGRGIIRSRDRGR